MKPAWTRCNHVIAPLALTQFDGIQEQRRKSSDPSAAGTPREDATPAAERKHGASGIKTGHAFLEEDDR